MIPGPSIDCPPVAVLADTGIGLLLPLMLGLIAVGFGVLFFMGARGKMRRSSIALGLVLLLGAGGTGLAVTAPASPASADACTPLDYLLGAERESEPLIQS